MQAALLKGAKRNGALNGDMQAAKHIEMRHLSAVANGDMQAAKRVKMRHLPAVDQI